jgi:hypothetical protein
MISISERPEQPIRSALTPSAHFPLRFHNEDIVRHFEIVLAVDAIAWHGHADALLALTSSGLSLARRGVVPLRLPQGGPI